MPTNSFMFLSETSAEATNAAPVMTLEEALMGLLDCQQDINTLNEALVLAEFRTIKSMNSLNEEAEEKAAAGDAAGADAAKKAADDKKTGLLARAGQHIRKMATDAYNKVLQVFNSAVAKVKSFFTKLRTQGEVVRVDTNLLNMINAQVKALAAMANAAAADATKEDYEDNFAKAKASFDGLKSKSAFQLSGKTTNVKVSSIIKLSTVAGNISAAQNKVLPVLKALEAKAEKDSDAAKALRKQITAVVSVAAVAAQVATSACKVDVVAGAAKADDKKADDKKADDAEKK